MKLCIIIPYRDREKNLNKLINHLHWFLPKNNIYNYFIVVTEQNNNKPFNKGHIMNSAYLQFKNEFDYVCFHDVDLIPLEADYTYFESPIHLCPFVEQFNYKIPYDTIFGGVTLFDKKSFEIVNGYSNLFYGWGAEDDDMFNRIKISNMEPHRRHIGRYLSLDHITTFTPETVNLENVKLMSSLVKTYLETKIINEGLNNTIYKLDSIQILEKYIHIKVQEIEEISNNSSI